MARNLSGSVRWWCVVMAVAVLVLAGVPAVRADFASAQKECTSTLLQLMVCQAYTSTKAANPTRDCCDRLGGVHSDKPQCLCVLILYRNEPLLQQYNIDLQRSLDLPCACNTPGTNITDCPRLLSLNSTSSEAKQFSNLTNCTPQSRQGNITNASGGLKRNYYKVDGMPMGWLVLEVFRGLLIATIMAILSV